MGNNTKNTKKEAVKKSNGFATMIKRLWSLVVTLAELVATFIFATQDNRYLWILAAVFAVDASIRLVKNFVLK